tara:strand:+ start:3882 stop:4130 length:249 start_codon:yes stop_codon:yes gene_type:complete
MALTEAQLSQELIDFIQENILDSTIEVQKETPLKSIGIDSFSIIELVLFLERKHNITIQEKDMLPENFQSVEALAKCAVNSL